MRPTSDRADLSDTALKRCGEPLINFKGGTYTETWICDEHGHDGGERPAVPTHQHSLPLAPTIKDSLNVRVQTALTLCIIALWSGIVLGLLALVIVHHR